MLDFGMHRASSRDAIMGPHHRGNRAELLYSAFSSQMTSSRGSVAVPEPQTHTLPLRRGNRGALLAEAMHSCMRRGSSASSSFKNAMKFVHNGAVVAPEQISSQQAAKKALHCCSIEYHQGKSKKWHKAWCAVASDGMLYMFHDDHSAAAEQILPLEHARILDDAASEHPLTILVEVTHGEMDTHVMGMQLRVANISQKRELTECIRRGKIQAAQAHGGGHNDSQDRT